MDVEQIATSARDLMTVRRVFGEPFEKDGTTIIPAVRIAGGSGAGGGQDPGSGAQGGGGGFGVSARPVGAFVISGGRTTWQPAIDVNRVILGTQIVAVAALLLVRTIVKSRAKLRIRELKRRRAT